MFSLAVGGGASPQALTKKMRNRKEVDSWVNRAMVVGVAGEKRELRYGSSKLKYHVFCINILILPL